MICLTGKKDESSLKIFNKKYERLHFERDVVGDSSNSGLALLYLIVNCKLLVYW